MSRKTRVDKVTGKIFFGERLLNFREEFLKMTQDEMAAILKVPQRQISDWETGKKDLTPGDIANIYYEFKDYKRFEETNIVGEYQELQASYWIALGVT